MDSWYGEPYTSSNTTIWVQLMNRSTADWGLAYFPPNLVALNGSLDDSWGTFADDTIVIENAGQTDIGDRGIEYIVFGITSSIAVVGILVFMVAGWMTKSLGLSPDVLGSKTTKHENAPPNNPSHAADDDIEVAAGGGGGGDEFMTDEALRRRLRDYYYPPIRTETELHEKDFAREPFEGEDVEAVTELLRRMYALDLELWSREGDPTLDRAAHQRKSDAVLAEVRRRVEQWTPSNVALTQEEAQELEKTRQLLFSENGIPPSRYAPQ